MPGTAAATRCLIAAADEKSSTDSVRMMTDADGCWRVRRNDPLILQHDMHPRALDALHGLDGARDLALQRPQPRDLLHEGGEAHRPHLVEQLVARVRAGRQALLRQQHARLRGLPAAHRHRIALRVDVEGYAGLFQGGADAADVLRVQADVQCLEVGPAQVVAAEADGSEDGEADEGEAGKTPRAQPK